MAGVHSSTFDWSLRDSGKYPRHGTEGERMNSKRALLTGLSNKIQGSHKMLLEGEETGKFHEQ